MKVTKIDDYVDAVHEKFPELTREEIKRILVYGWKLIILCVSAGNDFSVATNKEFLFIGKIPNNALKLFKNYCYKLSKRIAYMFKKSNAKWDGHYYFIRTESLYKDYLSQSRKKYKTFLNVFLYKLLEELRIKEPSAKYIFRLSEDRTDWMNKYYKEIRTKNAELIIVRDPLNMKDIMTSLNKFKYIQQ